MGLVVHNTLTKKYEPFEPLKKGRVSIYVCGITPYEESHIGHARSTVVWDVIKRYLTYMGYKVKLIQNFTDIEDKLIAKSKETGISPMDIARKYSDQYLEAMDELGVQRADAYPRASQVIPQIIEMIKGLIDKGYAYESSGDVYFIASKFLDYGKLSGKKLDELKPGARVELSEIKRSPADWALWKKSLEGEIGWSSPWGKGRPGWHIECSVMVREYLGESIDFHGGGTELIFPHHENEIAQSEAYTGKSYVKYWLHHDMVNLGGEKMSKSLGNMVSMNEILDRYDPMGVRLFLLSAHRLKLIEYSTDLLESAGRSWERINTCLVKSHEFLLNPTTAGQEDSSVLEDEITRCRKEFFRAMDHDFNSALALGCVHELVKAMNTFMFDGSAKPANSRSRTMFARGYATLLELCGILGLRTAWEEKAVDDSNTGNLVDLLIEIRNEARCRKDYETADRIRNKLAEAGYFLEDTTSGTKWKISK